MSSKKTLNVSGDKLEVNWDGNVWVAPCNGTQHARAEAAMRQELYRYLSDCDELPDGCDDASDLDLSDYGEMKSNLIRIEYSLDSLGDIPPELFEKACRKIATRRSLAVEFVVGLHNRETQDGEPCDLIVERAFDACCDCDL